MNKFRKLLLGAGAIVTIAVLTACGGGDDKSSALSTGGSSGSGQTLDLSKTAKNIQDLKSFNFDVSMKLNLGDLSGLGSPTTGSGSSGDFGAGLGAMLGLLGNVKASGSYVAPDQYSVTANAMGQQFSMVQIGKKSWTRQGTGKWTEGTASDSPLGSFSPTDLSSATDTLPPDALKNAKTSKESVNGVKTTRYSFDRKALMDLAKEGSSSTTSADFDQFDKAQMDLWISDDGIPVKMSMDLSGKDDKKQTIGIQLELNIKDLNSDAIKIKAPV